MSQPSSVLLNTRIARLKKLEHAGHWRRDHRKLTELLVLVLLFASSAPKHVTTSRVIFASPTCSRPESSGPCPCHGLQNQDVIHTTDCSIRGRDFLPPRFVDSNVMDPHPFGHAAREARKDDEGGACMGFEQMWAVYHVNPGDVPTTQMLSSSKLPVSADLSPSCPQLLEYCLSHSPRFTAMTYGG